jgi:hypothetical protein
MATLKIKQIVVEVTAEDREAAARYMKIIRDGRWSIEGILSGGCDNTSIVQAFARHRIAAQEQAVRAATEAAATACEEASGNALANGYSEAAEGMGDAAEIIRSLDPAQIMKGLNQ